MSAQGVGTGVVKRGMVDEVIVQMMSACLMTVRRCSGSADFWLAAWMIDWTAAWGIASCSCVTSVRSRDVSLRATKVIIRIVGTAAQRTRAWYSACAPEPKSTRLVAEAEMEGRDWMNIAEARTRRG